MLDIEQYRVDTFSKINSLNALIYSTETKMSNLFFDNVRNSSSEIILPLVAQKGDSDFERIEREKKVLKLEISDIDKKLANMQSFSNRINNSLKGKNLSDEQIKQKKQEELKKIELQLKCNKKRCLEKLELIESDPYEHLRFLDFKATNFSKVESKEIREELEKLDYELKKYIEERDLLLKEIKKAEKKENNLILGLNKKSSKKGIDNK